MQHVWFLFKFCEFVMGSICLAFHIRGLDELEPIPHVVFYCGTFFGFTLITLFGSVGILLGRGSKALMEAIISGAGAVMFLIASLLAMYHAEQDYHLMYLSDFEEPLHNFFSYCKQQSIASLATGLLFLLHCIFALDICIIRHRHISIFEDENEEAIQPLRMYFISKSIQKYLERYEWFRRYSKGDFSRSRDFQQGRSSKKSRQSSRPPRQDLLRLHSMARPSRDSDNQASVSSAIVTDNGGNVEASSSISTVSMAMFPTLAKTENA